MKENFPILKSIAYLDNAATTQKPKIVIEKIIYFYEKNNANTHRGVYDLSVKATNELEDTRKIIANFINAEPNEIFFVKNATEGFNVLAYSIEQELRKIEEKNIVTTILEHHSNLVPWIELSKRANSKLRVSKLPVEENIYDLIDENTKIVTLTMMSNVTGLIIDAETIIKKIRQKNKHCIIILDAAQAIAHQDIDVKKLDCDYLVFSGHKVYGPLGVGVVYGKKELINKLSPSMFGGGMIKDYKENSQEFVYNDVPQRFESGTLDVASISGLGEALKFFSNIKNKFHKETELKNFTLKELKNIKGIKIIGHDSDNYGPVISFTLDGVHPHDLASIADSFNVCIRAGHHCAKPHLNYLGLETTIRASISFYNDKEDILKLVDAIKKAKVIFDE